MSHDHKLQISGLRITIQIPDRIPDMFVDPMEQMILEVPLHLMVSYLSGAL